MVTKVLDKLYHNNYTSSYIIKNLSGKRDLGFQPDLFFLSHALPLVLLLSRIVIKTPMTHQKS